MKYSEIACTGSRCDGWKSVWQETECVLGIIKIRSNVRTCKRWCWRRLKWSMRSLDVLARVTDLAKWGCELRVFVVVRRLSQVGKRGEREERWITQCRRVEIFEQVRCWHAGNMGWMFRYYSNNFSSTNDALKPDPFLSPCWASNLNSSNENQSSVQTDNWMVVVSVHCRQDSGKVGRYTRWGELFVL